MFFFNTKVSAVSFCLRMVKLLYTMLRSYILKVSLALVGLLNLTAEAQRRKVPALGVLHIIGGTGLSYYMGDLREQIDAKNMGAHLALGISYRLTERLVARGEARVYSISGSQAGTRNKFNNLSFRSRNPDLYIGIQAELFKFSDEPKINPYVFGGVGLTYITPKANYQGQWYSLAPLQTEGVAYARTPRIVTAGIGVSWQFDKRWNVGLELSDNFANSDYLDDVSGVYPNIDGRSELSITLSDRRGELTPPLPPNDPGNVRGNPKIKDSYGFLSLRVGYLLGTRAKRVEKRKTRCSY